MRAVVKQSGTKGPYGCPQWEWRVFYCMRWWCCIGRDDDGGKMGCATSLPLGHRRHSSVASQPNNVTPDNNHHDKGNSVATNASSALHIVLNQNDRPSTGKHSLPLLFCLLLSFCRKLIRPVRRLMRDVEIPKPRNFPSYYQFDQSTPNWWTICRCLYNKPDSENALPVYY